jgi:signal transduction histidine kinase
MSTTRKSDIEGLLAGGGRMGALTRAFDWSHSPVGAAEGWPQSLLTALSICLSSQAPIIIFWGAEHVQFYNDAMLPILGAKHPLALGQRYQDCFPEVWELTGPMLQGVVERGETVGADDRLLVLERRGQPEECYFTWSYSPIRDDTGIPGVFTVATETTPRILRERRLRMLRDLATGLMEATSVEAACASVPSRLATDLADLPFAMMYLIDQDGASEPRLTGYAGVPADAPVQALDPWPFGAALTDGGVLDQQELERHLGFAPQLRLPDSAAEPVEYARVLPIRIPGQQPPAAVLVVGLSPLRLDADYEAFLELVARSIGGGISYARARETERRRAEALAELDQAKTAFFSNVSHEFRTPLTLLLGPLQDALKGDSLSGEGLQMANRNALRLVRLVNALLDFSRIEAGRINAAYQPTDLAVLTANVASNFESAITTANLRFVVDTPPLPEDMRVYVDHEMWEKIVLNLLSNALKHTFAGEISVTLEPTHAHQSVELVVRDTGIGIPADQLTRIFERFHRVQDARARSHEGSGIGLALVQELAQLHGGTASVESVIGQGSVFRVRIPQGSAHLPADQIVRPTPLGSPSRLAAPFVEEALRWLPEEPGELAATRQVAGGRGGRILVADDNADMRRYVSQILAEHWRVESVADGEAAVRAVGESMPDLLVLDVMMPRLDGFGVLHALRRDPLTRDVPVVVLSARAGEEASVEGLEAGANDYLIKPFGAAELVARVKTQLEAARARAEARAAATARDAFIAVVAHDLHHPLAALNWHVQILRRRLNSATPPEQAQLKELLEAIEECSGGLSAQIDELRDVSLIQSGRPLELRIERTDLVELVRRIVARYSQGSELQRVVLEDGTHSLIGAWDAERLQRVVANLISNALKFSPDGGDVVVNLSRQGDEAILTVEDHGLGIPAADLPHIFEPYARARNVANRIRGSGLGLAGARDIVKQHRGTLSVESAEGRGSTFVMRLPLDSHAASDDQPTIVAPGGA